MSSTEPILVALEPPRGGFAVLEHRIEQERSRNGLLLGAGLCVVLGLGYFSTPFGEPQLDSNALLVRIGRVEETSLRVANGAQLRLSSDESTQIYLVSITD